MNMEKQVKKILAEEDKSINLVDILMYLLSYWKWYVLSILICGGYFWYDYSRTPFVQPFGDGDDQDSRQYSFCHTADP